MENKMIESEISLSEYLEHKMINKCHQHDINEIRQIELTENIDAMLNALINPYSVLEKNNDFE
ncbi:MAG: hypothetical protein K2P99_01785 [Burkholderiales bacterium]|nr:hypothetical protein [Burkholderiales bacterium]